MFTAIKMPKRIQLQQEDGRIKTSDTDKCEITAQGLIPKQKTKTRTSLWCCKKACEWVRMSVWTRITSMMVEGDTPRFQCHVSAVVSKINRNLSSSNTCQRCLPAPSEAHDHLTKLNDQNASEDILCSVIHNPRRVLARGDANGSIEAFFEIQAFTSFASKIVSPDSALNIQDVCTKYLKAVPLAKYSWVAEYRISRVGSLRTQFQLYMFIERMRFSSEETVITYLLSTYHAVCFFIWDSATSSLTCSLILHGWIASLWYPILRTAWHFRDNDWRLKAVFIVTLNVEVISTAGSNCITSLMRS